MRMRQLGKGQSVAFFAPGEVDRRIRYLIPRDQDSGNGIRVIDALRWAMHETCSDILHHLPHWAEQGVDHHRRFSAYKQYDMTGKLRVLSKSWLQRESKTLEGMYEPLPKAEGAGLGPVINGIPALRERLERFGVNQLSDARMATTPVIVGDLIQMTILGQPIIIINSPKLAVDMLNKKSAIYSSRPHLTKNRNGRLATRLSSNVMQSTLQRFFLLRIRSAARSNISLRLGCLPSKSTSSHCSPQLGFTRP